MGSLSTGASFTNMAFTLIPAWISNYMANKVWDEITYPFLNFNGCAKWISILSHTLLCMWLVFHAGVIVNPY